MASMIPAFLREDWRSFLHEVREHPWEPHAFAGVWSIVMGLACFILGVLAKTGVVG